MEFLAEGCLQLWATPVMISKQRLDLECWKCKQKTTTRVFWTGGDLKTIQASCVCAKFYFKGIRCFSCIAPCSDTPFQANEHWILFQESPGGGKKKTKQNTCKPYILHYPLSFMHCISPWHRLSDGEGPALSPDCVSSPLHGTTTAIQEGTVKAPGYPSFPPSLPMAHSSEIKRCLCPKRQQELI